MFSMGWQCCETEFKFIVNFPSRPPKREVVASSLRGKAVLVTEERCSRRHDGKRARKGFSAASSRRRDPCRGQQTYSGLQPSTTP